MADNQFHRQFVTMDPESHEPLSDDDGLKGGAEGGCSWIWYAIGGVVIVAAIVILVVVLSGGKKIDFGISTDTKKNLEEKDVQTFAKKFQELVEKAQADNKGNPTKIFDAENKLIEAAEKQKVVERIKPDLLIKTHKAHETIESYLKVEKERFALIKDIAVGKVAPKTAPTDDAGKAKDKERTDKLAADQAKLAPLDTQLAGIMTKLETMDAKYVKA